MNIYGNCSYQAFEPVPDFNQLLAEAWEGENRMKIHKYGIGLEETTFQASKEVMMGKDGVSTFLGDSEGDNGEIQIVIIRDFEFAIFDSGGIPTMVQINCEGCEWAFLTEEIQHGWLKSVSIIQIGLHSHGEVGLGARAWQLCEIRQKLSETHNMDYGLAFGWERWSLKRS